MEKGKISALQMGLIMFPTIAATAILTVPGITASYAKQDLWLSPIWASFIGYMNVFIIDKLQKMHPNQTIIQYSRHIIGFIPGKVLGFAYTCSFILLTGQIVRIYAEFLSASFFAYTPISIIIVSMLFLCGLGFRTGIETLGRMAQLFFPLFVVPIIVLLLILIPDYNTDNIFPILENGLTPSLKGALLPIGWFTEISLITFLYPFLANKKHGLKSGMITVFVIMLFLVLSNLSIYFVYGQTVAQNLFPLMNASRYVSVADFFENLESVLMAVWILGSFVKISMFYYASVLTTAQWLQLSNYQPIIFPVGILIFECSFWGFPNLMEVSDFDIKATPYYLPVMLTIIPLLLLIVALLQKKRR
ncbi:endospore germination permease [Bacillus sp. FJAT-47783]|uniref:GerAB/ArcD/ProY family transporter n=1 Tax=Bacillus sp. FJAT-47783 TaxID=2922712 RepID=UPI001FAC65DC|nr:endospore germination permease [Bacillus sp. FJAT-47783]